MRQKKFYEVLKIYRACVLAPKRTPKWAALRKLLDLSLKTVTESIFGDFVGPHHQELPSLIVQQLQLETICLCSQNGNVRVGATGSGWAWNRHKEMAGTQPQIYLESGCTLRLSAVGIRRTRAT